MASEVVLASDDASLVEAARTRRAHALRVQLERLPLQLVSSWHAVGPVLVLAAAGERPFSWSRWPVYAAALGAQFVLDYWSAATRQWPPRPAAPRGPPGL